MGTYYMWVNPAKREWIDDAPFDDFGYMMSIASIQPCDTTDAACTLIAGRWHGDPVMYIGDGWPGAYAKEGYPLERYFDGFPYEDVLNNFTDVTGIFEQARGKTHADYVHAGDEVIRDVPYDGPFDQRPVHYRFAINHTRCEYVDRALAPIEDVLKFADGYDFARLDPIPSLYSPSNDSSEWFGRWCTDLVDMTDERPPEGYVDVTADACWDGATYCDNRLALDDQTIMQILHSAAFLEELEVLGIDPEPDDRSVVKGGKVALARLAYELEERDHVPEEIPRSLSHIGSCNDHGFGEVKQEGQAELWGIFTWHVLLGPARDVEAEVLDAGLRVGDTLFVESCPREEDEWGFAFHNMAGQKLRLQIAYAEDEDLIVAWLSQVYEGTRLLCRVEETNLNGANGDDDPCFYWRVYGLRVSLIGRAN